MAVDPGVAGTIQAIPMTDGFLPGECIFAGTDPTCPGRDGVRHRAVGDPCFPPEEASEP